MSNGEYIFPEQGSSTGDYSWTTSILEQVKKINFRPDWIIINYSDYVMMQTRMGKHIPKSESFNRRRWKHSYSLLKVSNILFTINIKSNGRIKTYLSGITTYKRIAYAIKRRKNIYYH